ncbi:hypothetical protein N7492_008609 [Penicillium capsulatum]|uniref:Lipoprotein n=1 Tax=Penicillium capsulatum TaxID=69766 RepID=A0A9W9HR12_9EURO|nr:hypothetical protein N7492_008609 [Penicillium capsulatum]KAJ6106014.1 hypothetical protein N7512_009531 [Penicillium capsulatum]
MRALYQVVFLAVALATVVGCSPAESVVQCEVSESVLKNGNTATRSYIESGNSYLHGLDAKDDSPPVNDVGRCSRVSCDENASIIWCNNSDEFKKLPNYGVIADGAQTILDECARKGEHYEVKGTATHTDRWTVMIRNTDCGKEFQG